MAALTKDRNTVYKEGIEVAYQVAGSTKIYAGSLVCINASGYAVPGADTSGYKFIGVAEEYVDNSGGSDGDETVKVRRKGVHQFSASSMALSDIGGAVYISDDQTAAKVTTNSIACGKVADVVSATSIYVDVDRI